MRTRPLRLLMVDDVQADMDLFQHLFESIASDVHFQTALGAQAALDLLDTSDRKPDLILLDLKMPELDGHAFLACLKAHSSFKLLPVVILTSSEQDDDIYQAYHGLASAYLIKPTTYEACRALVETFHGFWQHVRLPNTHD